MLLGGDETWYTTTMKATESAGGGRWGRRLLVATLVVGLTAGSSCAGDSAREVDLVKMREQMVRRQIAARGVDNRAVLEAMGKVPREIYVPEAHRDSAYADSPLPIGEGQTISQPYIVAAMTELLAPQPDHVVLEVGTGSGYQAAILAELVRQVYTIEIVPSLARSAEARLAGQGYTNVTVRAGDGYAGWPEHAPFDGILVTAAPDHVPRPLLEQLKPGGRMVIPVGGARSTQELRLIEKRTSGDIRETVVMLVRFVPFTGEGVRAGQGPPTDR